MQYSAPDGETKVLDMGEFSWHKASVTARSANHGSRNRSDSAAASAATARLSMVASTRTDGNGARHGSLHTEQRPFHGCLVRGALHMADGGIWSFRRPLHSELEGATATTTTTTTTATTNASTAAADVVWNTTKEDVELSCTQGEQMSQVVVMRHTSMLDMHGTEVIFVYSRTLMGCMGFGAHPAGVLLSWSLYYRTCTDARIFRPRTILKGSRTAGALTALTKREQQQQPTTEKMTVTTVSSLLRTQTSGAVAEARPTRNATFLWTQTKRSTNTMAVQVRCPLLVLFWSSSGPLQVLFHFAPLFLYLVVKKKKKKLSFQL